jgi:hypothetical protein
MVLDFLFGCHNLKSVYFLMGDGPGSDTIRFAPFFYFPTPTESHDPQHVKKTGAGSHFAMFWGRVQEGAGWAAQAAGYHLNERETYVSPAPHSM